MMYFNKKNKESLNFIAVFFHCTYFLRSIINFPNHCSCLFSLLIKTKIILKIRAIIINHVSNFTFSYKPEKIFKQNKL
jgi:hypothetical protein